MKLPIKTLITISAIFAVSFAQARTITVSNESGKDIWVTVAAQQVLVKESSDGYKVHREFENHHKFNTESSAGIEGIGNFSQKLGIEVNNRRVAIDEGFKNRKFAWSPFIEAGEEKISSGRTGRFEVPDSQKLYFLTVRNSDGILAINSPKSATKHAAMTVDSGGFAAPPKKMPIRGSSKILLSASKGGKKVWISNPISSKGYPSGNYGSSAQEHYIYGGTPISWTKTPFGASFPKEYSPIYDGETISLETTKTTHKGYVYMYCSVQGWTYYNDERSDDTCRWIIKKVRKSSADDKVIRDGDQVLIQNKYYDRYHLDAREDDRWVTSTNTNNPLSWTISIAK
ncbi:MAG: hypothetical protein AAF585_21400 [Verrucomicrobiota bacterium]